MKKILEIDEKAYKELKAFSKEVQAKFFTLFKILEEEGFLIQRELPACKGGDESSLRCFLLHSGTY